MEAAAFVILVGLGLAGLIVIMASDARRYCRSK